MEKFEVVPPFREYETRDSFLSRLAALNQMVSVDDLRRLVGLSNARLHYEAGCRMLLAMAGVDHATALLEAPETIGGYTSLAGHSFNNWQVSKRDLRFCPACVCNDIENGTGPIGARPFQRSWWLWRLIETCPQHGCSMMVAPASHSSMAADLCSFVTQNIESIREQLARVSKTDVAHPYELYLHGRIVGGHEIHELLDRLPLAYVTRICERIGFDALDQAPDGTATERMRRGFELLSLGKERFFDYLDDRVREDERTRVYGSKSRYGRAYTMLSVEVTDPHWEPVRKFYWEDARQRLPMAAGEEFLGYVLEARLLHSTHTAKLAYGIHPHTLDKMFLTEANKLVEGRVGEIPCEKGRHVLKSARSSILPVAVVERMVEEFNSALKAKDVYQMLGLSEAALFHFRAAGIVRAIDPGSDTVSQKTTYRRKDVENLLVYIASVPTGLLRGDYRSFLGSSRWSGLNPAAIYPLIYSGKVRCLKKKGGVGFESLYVNRRDLADNYLAFVQKGLTLAQTAKFLSIPMATVYGLLENGYLLLEPRAVPLGRASKYVVNERSVHDFKAKYAGVSTIATDLGITNKRVRTAIVLAGLEPLFSPAEGRRRERAIYETTWVVEAVRKWDRDFSRRPAE